MEQGPDKTILGLPPDREGNVGNPRAPRGYPGTNQARAIQNQAMNNTDTPQTNAWAHWDKDGDIELVYASISRSLERELNLQKQINTGKEISREVIIEERDELQTEVEKLREQLVKYRELANEIFSHTSSSSVYHMQYSDWKDKLKTLEEEAC